MTSGERKAGIRRTSRDARAALSASERDLACRAVAERALSLPEVASARAVLSYAPLPEEVDPAPIVRALRARGARIALPRVCGPGELALHWVESDTPLEPGAFGIREPSAECAAVAPADLDLVLVPGVAFDAACNRLGFGGGYYDALLASLPSSVARVGLAFDEQMCESVPQEAHDAAMDAVVTPAAIHRRGA
jgi:5-formyltetrahydrofolate cyclo-ligase